MHKIWAIIRREFMEKIRTRAFLIGTVLGPLILLGLTLMPVLLDQRETAPKRIAVVDGASGTAGIKVTEALSASRRPGATGAVRYTVSRVPADGRVEPVRDSLIAITGLPHGTDALDGVLVLTDQGIDSGHIPYLGVNVGSPGEMDKLASEVQTSLRLERLQRAGIDPFIALPALRQVDIVTSKVTGGKVTGESGHSSFLLAYFMGFVLYIALLLYGVQVMSSVVEEKTSRIAEVLAASVTPFQMMLGKVLGVGGAGLLQLSIWGITATLVTTYKTQLARLLGASPDSLTTMSIPSMRPDLLAVFLIYFVLGFLLFAAAYAAVAALCSTQQEAQQANTPVTFCIMAGFIAMFSLLNDPSGSLARTLSLVPIVAPFVVPVRYSLAPIPLPELLLSMALLLAAVLAVTWVAGRVYRVGILMYGKKPKLSEVWRWIRAS